MLTKIYKIVDKKDIPIYIGVTTCTINRRFYEHILSKYLNIDEYRCELILTIKHKPILTLEDYVSEKKKIKELEQYYINYYSKTHKLLNMTAGGEWGSNIIHRLLNKQSLSKENFRYFSELYFKQLMNDWISTKTRNSVESLFKHWINHKTESYVKNLLKHWIMHRSASSTKILLQTWINKRGRSIVKDCLKNWIFNKNKTIKS